MRHAGIVESGYEVRAAVPGDIPSLIGLCAEHAQYERATYSAASKPDLLQRALFAEPARLFAWIAWNDQVAIGYATATVDFSTWDACQYLHMDCLFVQDHARGKAVGTKLLHAAIEKARALGLRELQWQTPDWNHDAMGFYARHGASAKPKQRFVLTLDDT